MKRRTFTQQLGWLTTGSLFLPACQLPASQEDEPTISLYPRFQNPEGSARPFVRWWWPNNQVERAELGRELQLLSEAGIGGVEIVPIGTGWRPTEGLTSPKLPWLGDEWCELVRDTCEMAKSLGLQVDLSHSFGWPARGDWLWPEHRAQTILTQKVILEGPTTWTSAIVKLKGWQRGTSELAFAKLIPQQLDRFEQIQSFESTVSDGVLRIEVPAGKHELHLGILVKSFKKNMLDHYNASAVLAYHEHLSERLRPYLGEDWSGYFRSVFADSIEVGGANWTADLPAIFKVRRGYDMTPFLAFLPRAKSDQVPFNDTFKASKLVADQIRRVRFDYHHTLVELIHENFITVFDNWCQQHRVKSRLQVYGWPWHFGVDEGYVLPDIPEGNNWLAQSATQRRISNTWNKFTASGGHIAGRSVISTEAMTTVNEVFEITLDQVKRADDFNFIQGINHSILHGFNYSPPSVPFPGVVVFGTFFSPYNPWWPHFQRWTARNSRLSQLWQDTQPITEIAILGPRTEAWENAGLWRGSFHDTAWYAYDYLWPAFANYGLGADLIGENLLQQSTTDATGTLEIGKARYQLLLLCDLEVLEADTWQSIVAHVEAGGQVALIGKAPMRFAGGAPTKAMLPNRQWKNWQQQDRVNVKQVAAPTSPDAVFTWVNNLLQSFTLQRHWELPKPHPSIFWTQRKTENTHLIFATNQSDTADLSLSLNTLNIEGTPQQWQPDTGQRSLFDSASTKKITLHLPAGHSQLLVFEREASAKIPEGTPQLAFAKSKSLPISWIIKAKEVNGNLLDTELSADQKLMDNPTFQYFSGSLTYKGSFTLENLDWHLLDFGHVQGTSTLRLNGQNIGSVWYGHHRYEVAEHLRKGRNQIELEVTTVLHNHMRQRLEYLPRKIWPIKANRTMSFGLTDGVWLRQIL